LFSYLPKGDSAYINRLNKIKVLSLIRDKKEISRAEIVKITGISAPTVTRVVESLISEEKLVCQVGKGNSNGGRPPIMIQFEGENNFVIGVDLGTTSIRGALSNLNARLISEIEVPTEVDSGFDNVMKKVSDVIEKLILHPIVKSHRIFGVGMAVAGLINSRNHIVEFSPDFGWIDADISSALKPPFDSPIIFDNVSRVMALGELWYGIGRDIKNFIFINVGYGIGAGIIIDGKPFYGSEGMSGEFGHMTMEMGSTVQCKCGKFGCLEALASGRGIAAAAERELKSGAESALRNLCGGDFSRLTAEMVFQSAKEGDPLALRIFRKTAEYIGIGIATLIDLFNPQAIIVGGGVSRSGEEFLDQIRESVKTHVIQRHNNFVKIIPATFGADAAVMGSVSLILEKVLTFDSNNDQ
jgi:glucokinase-like ROK family protein